MGGVTKNDVEAVNWYRKAAEQGMTLLNPISVVAITVARA